MTLSSPTEGTLAAGEVGTAYSQTFAASGGTGFYTYAVTNGALPGGLTLASNGQLTGTPTTVENASFTVTATDGNGVADDAAYTLQINASTDATLSNLVLSQGTLTPGFSSGTKSYTASVGNAVTSLTVTPTVADANATVTVNGTPATSGIASSAISLNVGSNIINVVVTAQDNTTTETYTVTVTRAGSAVATLSNLVLSQGTLTPTFSSGTTSYTASVGNAVTSLTVTPTLTNANATVTVNSVAVTSGNASGAISLNVGSNIINVVVTAQDNTTTETYTVTVTRAGSAVATLSNLVLSQGTLTPGFSSGTTSYTASVGNAVTSLTVTPTVTDANATVTVNSTTVASGNASGAINLNVGDNTITVVGTAQDGTTTQTYTVTVNRAAAPVTITFSPAAGSLTAGQVSTAYTQSVTASGGTGPYTYAVTNGALPAGLTLNIASGDISGTPTAVETASFTITATDANNVTVSANYAITVAASVPGAPTIGSATAGDAQATVSFTAPTSNGGAAITGYTVTASPGGATATGSASPITVIGLTNGTAYTFTVTATNTAGTGDPSSASNSVTPAAVLLAPVANAVSETVAANSSANAITLNITGGAAASVAVATQASHGTATASGTSITYTPTAGYSGTDSFTYTATNTTGTSAPATVTITITAPTFTFSPAAGTLTAATVGVSYSETVTASGGTASYTYAVTSGSLPTGLSLNTSTGEISGTPTTAESVSFTITATDANSVTGSANYAMTVAASVPGAPTIGSATAGDAQATVSFTAPTSNGGAAITGYTVTASPGGATATGSASPITVIGLTNGTSYTFTVTATNTAGTGDPSSASNSVTPAAALLAPVANAVSETVAANSSANAITLNITGGAAASVAVATQASHGTATASGTSITYTPTAGYSGTDSFTYTATNTTGTSAPATVTITITAPTFTFSPAAGSLTAGEVGTAYTQSVTASGGTGPYTYAVTNGALPAGLSLNTGTGEISGTPITAGTANFTITATDANSDTGDASYTLNVTAAPASISFSPAGGALPEAMEEEDYSAEITVSGGTGPYLFSISGGALPPGMILNVSTGALSGPLDADTEGSYSFTIAVSDSNNAVASASYTLEVTERAVTVTDKVVSVPAGSTPANVNLATGATGGPFVSADLLSVEPANAGTARIVNGEFAQASGGGSAGFYLKFTPDPAYSGQVIVRFSLTSALGASNAGIVTYNLGYDPVEVAQNIDTLVQGFVQTRQNLIASTIKVPGLRERRRMQNANEIVSTRFSPSVRGMTLGFATSLEQMNAAGNALNPDLKAEPLRLNVWFEGSVSAHTRKQNNDRWGSFAMLSGGADYLLADWALLGVSLHYDRMTDPSDDDATLTGNGWLAGPYASIEIHKNVYWDTRLFFGGSSNDIDTEFWDGTFDTTRWMADTSLTGDIALDSATTLTPKLRMLYLSETVEDYEVGNSAGDAIIMDGFLEEQFRVSGALELARVFLLGNGLLLTPSVELTGGYAGLDGSGAFGAAEAGLMLTDGSVWRLNAGVKVNVEGDGSTSLTARAGAGARF